MDTPTGHDISRAGDTPARTRQGSTEARLDGSRKPAQGDSRSLVPVSRSDLPEGFRPATRDDAAAMAELVNMAGDGLPLYLWTRMASPGQDPWEVGRQRARRESGAFSWRNTVVSEVDARVAACLIGYPLPDQPEPTDYSELPALFVPMQQLEDLAPRTWYVNVLATYPDHRRRGHATALLDIAARLAGETGRDGLSIIVADSNTGARRLYERAGFREHATRPMVKEDWDGPGDNWVLLVRDDHS